MRKILFLGLLVAVMGAGCAGSTVTTVAPSPAPSPVAPPSVQPPAPEPTSEQIKKVAPVSVMVEIKDFAFSPKVIAINPGDTVIWTNKGKTSHTVTGVSGAFLWDSGNLTSGESYHRTFSAEGRYEYHCNIHPGMTGTVVVGKVIPSK